MTVNTENTVAMVALLDLRSASFRGARFLVPRDEASEGPNVIDHTYPDGRVRYAEYNGYIPPEINLTAVLHGDNLLSQFNALRSALNQPSPGTLHHPWLGSLYCAVKGPWRVTREDTDSGVLTLEICFLVTGPAVFPRSGGGIAAQVTSLSVAFLQSAFDEFAAAYGDPTLSVPSLSVLSEAVTDVGSVFNSELGGVAGVAIAAGHLTETPERYVESGADLVDQLYSMYRGAFEDLDSTYSSQEIGSALSLVDAATTRAFVAADAIPTGSSTITLDYDARASALYTFSTFCRMATVSCMAEALAGTTFKTADEVAAAESLLLSLYASVPTDRVPHATGKALADVVAAAMAVLKAEELQLPKIETLKIYGYPASVLAYQLYEDDARTDLLVELNIDQNPVLLDRQASVLIGVDGA